MARSIHESFSSIQCGIWHRPNKRPWLRILQTVKFKMSNYCVLPGRRYVDLAAQGTKRDSEMLTVAEVLLVADVLVGGDKDIKQTFGKAEKFAILNASPIRTHSRRCTRGLQRFCASARVHTHQIKFSSLRQ